MEPSSRRAERGVARRSSIVWFAAAWSVGLTRITHRSVAGKEVVDLRLNTDPKAAHGVVCNQLRIGDTVLFLLKNPQRIPVQYRISRGKLKYEEGSTNDSIWVKTIPDPGGNNFDLNYTFIWGGEPQEEKAELDYFSKILAVQIEQPQQVMPGETVPIKVKVTGKKQKAAASVDITSGAVNTLFEGASYDVPEVTERIKQGPLQYRLFSIEPAEAGFRSWPGASQPESNRHSTFVVVAGPHRTPPNACPKTDTASQSRKRPQHYRAPPERRTALDD